MTTPIRSREMMSGVVRAGAKGAGLLALAVLLTACKKAPPPPPPPQQQPPPAPEPEQLDVAGLLQSMDVDARVEFAEDQAPVSRDLAEAAIHLADAFARGDSAALESLLDKTDQQRLSTLLANDEWRVETEKLEAVRVVSIDATSRLSEEPEATELALALQDPDGAYVLVWSGRKVFDDWIFTGRPATDEERARASEWDGMSAGALMESAVDTSSMLAGIEPGVLAQLTQFGIDPANPDPEKLQAFIDEFGDRLPPPVVERLRQILESLQGDEKPAEDEAAPEDDEAPPPTRRGGDEGGGGGG